MSEPQTLAEYEQRFKENYKTEGFGIGNIWITFPCIFCAAPDYMKVELLQMEEESKKEHVCSECGRGSKTIYDNSIEGVTKFRIVQTRGDAPASWVPVSRE